MYKITCLSLIVMLILGSAVNTFAVTYHEPDPKIEEGLNRFGAGVRNWEQQHLGAFTYPDAHLYHKYALVETKLKRPLKVDKQLDLTKIEIFAGNQTMDLYSFMRDRANIHNYVVMKKDGTIIGEDYWNGTNSKTKNHLMSASKSFSAIVAAIAAEKGFFKYTDPVDQWISELKGSPLEGVPVQYFADMRAGVRTIDAEYDDENNYHWSMGEWSTWDWAMALASGYNGFDVDEDGNQINRMTAHGRLDGIEDFIEVLGKKVKLGNKPGEGYNYKCVNTEILGLVAERAIAKNTGQSFLEFMETDFWQKAGFQDSVALYLDLNHKRTAYSGGFNMTSRDFALANNLMANGGKNHLGEQIIPNWFVDEVRDGNDAVKKAWKWKDNQEQVADPDGFYTQQFRTVHINGRKISAMVGVNGQYNVIDWKTGNTLAMNSSFGKPSGESMIATFFSVIDAVFSAAEKL